MKAACAAHDLSWVRPRLQQFACLDDYTYGEVRFIIADHFSESEVNLKALDSLHKNRQKLVDDAAARQRPEEREAARLCAPFLPASSNQGR